MSLAKKLLIALGAVVGLFVVAFVVLVLVVDVGAFARKARDATVASLTDTLGRDVTLGEVDATIFPKLGMRATDLRVAGTTASAAPLVEARALRATISLWDVIRSLGKDVRVAEIVVTEPVLHVERDANGRFPDAAILERLSDRDGAPLDPATIERIERARIDRLVVERGRVVFVDHSVTREGAELVLAPIALEVTNLGLGLAPHVELDVGVAARPALHVEAATSALAPTYPLPSTPTLASLDLTLDALALAPFAPWIGELPIDVGDARLSSKVSVEPADGVYAVVGETTLTGLAARGVGAPFDVRLEHDVRAGEVVHVRALRAELAPLIVDASGTIHATGRPRAELAFSTNAIDLVALARVVPALAISADRAELRATGTVRGTLDDPSSQTITVDALTLRAAETELTGTARLQNPARPAITFTLASPMLDVDALTPRDAGPERTPAERTPEERRALANLDVRGTLRAARGVLKGVAFQDLDVALTMREGVVGFERLAASAWGGRVDGAGTRFDVVREAVQLAMKLRGTAADTLLARSAALSSVLTGSIDADLELSFHGLEWDAIAKTLGGRAELALEGGRLTSFALPDAVAKPLAAALPFARDFAGLGAADGGGTALRTLRVAFDVGGGLLKIARALEVTTPHGTANLAGAVGLDGALALAGSFAFTPDTIATLTRRRVQLDRALPVAIELGCTLRAPCLEGVNVERAATALTEAAAGRVKREVLERAAAPVEDAKEKAEAEATKRLEEQKRRGEARKKELEEEAKRRAKDFLGF